MHVFLIPHYKMNKNAIAKFIYWLEINVLDLNNVIFATYFDKLTLVWKYFDLSNFVFSIYSDLQKLKQTLDIITFEIALQQYTLLEERYFYSLTLF